LSSSDSPADFDLERDLPTTPADVAASRRLAPVALPDFEAYLRFLANFPPPTADALRARPGPRGEAFALVEKG